MASAEDRRVAIDKASRMVRSEAAIPVRRASGPVSPEPGEGGLRAALEFYAADATYKCDEHEDELGVHLSSPILDDSGDRARQALAATPVPGGDEREEAHLAAVVAMHRRELLAFGQYAAIVHPEDLPVDYSPGMKLVKEPAPGGGDGLEAQLAVAQMERDWLLGAWAAATNTPQAEAEAEFLAWSAKWRASAVARSPTLAHWLAELLTSDEAVEEMAFRVARRELWSHFTDFAGREARQRNRWDQLTEATKDSWRQGVREDLAVVASCLSSTTKEQRKARVGETVGFGEEDEQVEIDPLTRVRVKGGDYAGQTGDYSSRCEVTGGHFVYLDSDGPRDPAASVSAVEILPPASGEGGGA